MEKQYKNLKKQKNKKEGTLDVEAEIPYDVVAGYRDEAIKELQKDFEAPGFRKGKAPTDLVVEKVGEPKILQQAAEAALQDVAPQILKDEDMMALGSPQVAITKIAPGNDLGFKMRIAMAPDVKLPNYKKIAKQVIADTDIDENVEVTDEDVEAVITQLRTMRAPKAQDARAGEKNNGVPELNDAFAKEVGFDDVATLKTQIRKNLEAEKKMDGKKKLREKMVEALVDAVDITIPEMVVSQEVGLIRGRFYQELSQAGLTMEDYLERSKTTEEELNEQHREHVVSQLTAKFIIEKIAQEEGIKPDEKEMEQQRQILQSRHPEATEDQINNHLTAALTHEKVFQFLESLLIEAS